MSIVGPVIGPVVSRTPVLGRFMRWYDNTYGNKLFETAGLEKRLAGKSFWSKQGVSLINKFNRGQSFLTEEFWIFREPAAAFVFDALKIPAGASEYLQEAITDYGKHGPSSISFGLDALKKMQSGEAQKTIGETLNSAYGSLIGVSNDISRSIGGIKLPNPFPVVAAAAPEAAVNFAAEQPIPQSVSTSVSLRGALGIKDVKSDEAIYIAQPGSYQINTLPLNRPSIQGGGVTFPYLRTQIESARAGNPDAQKFLNTYKEEPLRSGSDLFERQMAALALSSKPSLELATVASIAAVTPMPKPSATINYFGITQQKIEPQVIVPKFQDTYAKQRELFLSFARDYDIFNISATASIDTLLLVFNEKLEKHGLNRVSEAWIKENLPNYYRIEKTTGGNSFIESWFNHNVNKWNYTEMDWLSGGKIEGLEDYFQYGVLSLDKYQEVSGKDDKDIAYAETIKGSPSEHRKLVWLTSKIGVGAHYSHSNAHNFIAKEPGLIFVFDKSISKDFDQKIQVSDFAATIKDQAPWDKIKYILIPQKHYSKAIKILKGTHPEWNRKAFADKQLSDILVPVAGDNIEQYGINAKIALSKLYIPSSKPALESVSATPDTASISTAKLDSVKNNPDWVKDDEGYYWKLNPSVRADKDGNVYGGGMPKLAGGSLTNAGNTISQWARIHIFDPFNSLNPYPELRVVKKFVNKYPQFKQDESELREMIRELDYEETQYFFSWVENNISIIRTGEDIRWLFKIIENNKGRDSFESLIDKISTLSSLPGVKEAIHTVQDLVPLVEVNNLKINGIWEINISEIQKLPLSDIKWLINTTQDFKSLVEMYRFDMQGTVEILKIAILPEVKEYIHKIEDLKLLYEFHKIAGNKTKKVFEIAALPEIKGFIHNLEDLKSIVGLFERRDFSVGLIEDANKLIFSNFKHLIKSIEEWSVLIEDYLSMDLEEVLKNLRVGTVTRDDFKRINDTIFDWLMQNGYLELISDTEGRLIAISDELKAALDKDYPNDSRNALMFLQRSRLEFEEEDIYNALLKYPDGLKRIIKSDNSFRKQGYLGMLYYVRKLGLEIVSAGLDHINKDKDSSNNIEKPLMSLVNSGEGYLPEWLLSTFEKLRDKIGKDNIIKAVEKQGFEVFVAVIRGMKEKPVLIDVAQEIGLSKYILLNWVISEIKEESQYQTFIRGFKKIENELGWDYINEVFIQSKPKAFVTIAQMDSKNLEAFIEGIKKIDKELGGRDGIAEGFREFAEGFIRIAQIVFYNPKAIDFIKVFKLSEICEVFSNKAWDSIKEYSLLNSIAMKYKNIVLSRETYIYSPDLLYILRQNCLPARILGLLLGGNLIKKNCFPGKIYQVLKKDKNYILEY